MPRCFRNPYVYEIGDIGGVAQILPISELKKSDTVGLWLRASALPACQAESTMLLYTLPLRSKECAPSL